MNTVSHIHTFLTISHHTGPPARDHHRCRGSPPPFLRTHAHRARLPACRPSCTHASTVGESHPHTTTPSHLPSRIPALPFSCTNHPLSLTALHLPPSPSRVNQCQPPPRPELLDVASNRHGELVDMTSMLTQ